MRPAILSGIAMALALATGTGCQNKKAPPIVVQSPLADSAEQIMFNAKNIMTDRGLLRAELLADTAYFFEDNTRIEMRHVHITFHGSNGAKSAVLTARQGTFNTRTNIMEGRGDVLVITEDGRQLTSPQLRYDQGRDQVSSDSAFVLTEPGRHVEGIGFVSDPALNNIRILKTKSGSSAGPIVIPNQ